MGRLVIEATWTPGLPTVVTTLVSTTSRFAAAPFMTRIVAGPMLLLAPGRAPKAEGRPDAQLPGAAPGAIWPSFMIVVFS